jgi:cbb3-type cytochrome oxidase subunit 3
MLESDGLSQKWSCITMPGQILVVNVKRAIVNVVFFTMFIIHCIYFSYKNEHLDAMDEAQQDENHHHSSPRYLFFNFYTTVY